MDFEHDLLIIRNHKDEPLAQLSFANGRFQGHEGNVALGLRAEARDSAPHQRCWNFGPLN